MIGALCAVFIVVFRKRHEALSQGSASDASPNPDFDARASAAHSVVMERFASESDEEDSLPDDDGESAYAKTPGVVDSPSAYAKTPDFVDTPPSAYAKTPDFDGGKKSRQDAYAKTPSDTKTEKHEVYAKTPADVKKKVKGDA